MSKMRFSTTDQYKAFISYEHDSATSFAESLESSLKSYAKPLLQRPIKVFRDEKHFSVGIDLPKMIRDALDNSEYLILLASPSSAASTWVEDELKYWCSDADRLDRLIILLLDGTIVIDEAAHRIDPHETSALPSSICEMIETVPLYLDLRELGSAGADMSDPRFRDAVNRISARFQDRDPNDMIGEEVRQHRRNIRLRNVSIGLLTALTIVAAVSALVANEQRKTADSRLLAAQSQQPELRVDESIRRAVEAYEVKETLDAELAMRRVWQQTSGVARVFVAGYPISASARNAAGSLVVLGGSSGELGVLDSDTGETIMADRIDGGDPIASILFPDSGQDFIALSKSGAFCTFITATRSRSCAAEHIRGPIHGAYRSGDVITVAHDLGRISRLDLSGTIIDEYELPRIGHEGVITAAALHPSGELLAVATYDSQLRLVDLESKVTTPIRDTGVVWDLTFDTSGEYLAAAFEDGRISIYAKPGWQLASSASVEGELQHVAIVEQLGVVVASSGATIRSWSFPSLEPNAPFAALHRGRIAGLVPHPSAGTFFSASEDGVAISWMAHSPKLAERIDSGDFDYFALDTDGKGETVFAGRSDGAVVRIDLTRASPEPVVLARQATAVRALGRSPDGRRIAFGGQAVPVRILSLDGNGAEVEIPVPEPAFYRTEDVVFVDGGSSLVTANINRLIQKWHINTQELLWETRLPLPTPSIDSLCCIETNADRSIIVAADKGGFVYQINTADGSEIREPLKMHRFEINALSLATSTGNILTSALDRRILTYDRDGNVHCDLKQPDGGFTYSTTQAKEANYLFSISEGSMGVWDSADCRLVFELTLPPAPRHARISSSADGSRIVWTKPDLGLWLLRMPGASRMAEELRSQAVYLQEH